MKAKYHLMLTLVIPESQAKVNCHSCLDIQVMVTIYKKPKRSLTF